MTIATVERMPTGAHRRIRRARIGRTRRRRSFVLMEVLVSVVILGIALAAVLRCCTNALKALSRDRTLAQAVLLAQGLIEDFEIEPPEEDATIEGDFGPDFPGFSYIAEFKFEKIDYRAVDMEIGLRRKEFVPVCRLNLSIYYEPDNAREARRVLYIETALTALEKYASQTKVLNAMF